MNQAIIFIDNEIFQSFPRGILFPAFVNGLQINCFISSKSLQQRFKCSEESEQLIAIFRQYRWQLEDEAEKLIKNDDYTENGDVILD